MSSESWVRTHRQRIQAEALEGARLAELAQHVTAEGRGLRTILAGTLITIATWLDSRPRAAGTGAPMTSRQPLR